MIVLHRALPALSGIRCTAESTRLECEPDSNIGGTGTLYICEKQPVFFCEKEKRGFSLDYQNIVIHAVSKEPNEAVYLYCQLDCQLPGLLNSSVDTNGKAHDSGEEDSEQGDEEQFAEMRFYPKDTQILDELFKAMCDCAALNPDTGDDSDGNSANNEFYKSDANGEKIDADGVEKYSDNIQTISGFNPSDFITSEDQLDQLSKEGEKVLAHLESVIVLPDNETDSARFADIDEDLNYTEKTG
ncbi:Methylosome subunit pICln [Coemansia sp. RSA 988]|nr:Methylosome subunit pICln [Coemansia sp. RSA 988]